MTDEELEKLADMVAARVLSQILPLKWTIPPAQPTPPMQWPGYSPYPQVWCGVVAPSSGPDLTVWNANG